MKHYLAILPVIILCGCELVVDVDIPIEKQRLVLNSFFTPDSVWKAKVSLSRHILDDAGYNYIDNAKVIVFDGDIPIDTLQHDTLGYYRSNDGGPKYSKAYSIRASAPGYDDVGASSWCPRPVHAEFSTPQATVGEFNEPLHTFSITFNDLPGKDFYQVMAIAEYRYTHPQTGQGFINRYNPFIYSEDTAIDPEEIANTEGFLFPDVLFDGKQFTVNVKMSSRNWAGGPDQDTKYFIFLRSVSEDFYKYKTTTALQDYTSGDPFAQPVRVYNNIQNGFGIFAGYSQSTYEFGD